ncbi:isocitrate/isopropylmalate dehydrogenase family protein [bacterium]|nr:isocitrate/isopropylmalate dehydrogenase family protein [bacterium]
MAYRVTLIPGDGIGPELTEATVRCLEATGVQFEWERFDAGADYMARTGDSTPLPQAVIDSIKKNKIALKGPLTTPIGTGFRSVNVALRQELDLYACVRPCKLYPSIDSKFQNVDIVIVRENTEDLYAGIEFEKGSEGVKEITATVEKLTGRKIKSDAAISLKPITDGGSERIVRYAFEYAKRNNRKKVTLVHKANIMKYTDGLFLEVGRRVAQEYPEIQFEDLIIDNTCMQLVVMPHNFDVIVTENLYGDILSDLCAGLIGGLGVAPGSNVGTIATVYEPTHGSAPKYAGLNKANPLAQLLSGLMMLRDLGEMDAATRLEAAIIECLKERKVTYDLMRDTPEKALSTSEFADAIVAKLHKTAPVGA